MSNWLVDLDNFGRYEVKAPEIIVFRFPPGKQYRWLARLSARLKSTGGICIVDLDEQMAGKVALRLGDEASRRGMEIN